MWANWHPTILHHSRLNQCFSLSIVILLLQMLDNQPIRLALGFKVLFGRLTVCQLPKLFLEQNVLSAKLDGILYASDNLRNHQYGGNDS
jgi:hypothetical protein